MLAGLAKMRAEVADDHNLFRWISVMLKHVEINVPLSKLPQLAALARQMDPKRLNNVVAPGRVGTAGSASVVYLTKDAATLFNDLRDDAAVGTPLAVPANTTTSSSSTSTTARPTTTTAPTTTTTTVPLVHLSTTTSTSPTSTSTTTTSTTSATSSTSTT